MVVFLDTNVVIDYFGSREHSPEAKLIFDYCSEESNEGIIASLSLATFFYVSRKALSAEERMEDIKTLASLFTIGSVDSETVSNALSYNMDDFEDALQVACAASAMADCIITNNPKDFVNAPLTVLTSSEFVERYCTRP